MHVGLFVTASQGLWFARQTVSVQNRGRDGLPGQLFPQGVRHKFGLI